MKPSLQEAARVVGSPVFRAELEADARALWALRVLDADGRARDVGPMTPWPSDGGFRTAVTAGVFSTEEAARLAAALAVWTELPADFRAELGECP